MEVAGLVLGSFVILDIAERAIAIASVIHDINAFPQDVSELLYQLANEAQKIEVWAAEAALYTDVQKAAPAAVESIQSGISRAVSTAVERILISLDEARAVTDRIGVTNALQRASVASLACISDLSQQGRREEVFLGAKTRQQLVEQSLSTKKLRKRTAFTLTPWGQSDKQKLRDLIESLKYWNGELWTLLASQRRLALDFEVSCQILAVAAEDQATLKTVQESPASSKQLAARAALAQTAFAIEQTDAAQLRTLIIPWNRFEWPATTVLAKRQLITMKATSVTGALEEGRASTVMIEWLEYSVFPKGQRSIMFTRVTKLAEFLNAATKAPGLCTLRSHGLVRDDARSSLGMIFETPTTQNPQGTAEIRVLSLLGILKAQAGPRGGHQDRSTPKIPRPTLLQRFQLARRLAVAFMELHNARWLHKGFSSDCVLFFVNSPETGPVEKVYDGAILAGFQYSRPIGQENESLPTAHTEDMKLYQHPRLSADANLSIPSHANPDATVSSQIEPGPGVSERPRFRPAFDIYSLGVVLLEIGLWQPIKTFYATNTDASWFQDRLCKLARANLPHIMGDKYAAAVLTCLGSEFRMPDQGYGSTEDEQKDTVRELRRIYWEIVKPLEECHCRP